MNLDSIFVKYNTDKGSTHNYSPIYEQYLQGLKNRPIKMLEIGVQSGSSIHAWYEYLPTATIIGMDVEDKRHLENDRIKIFKGHQGIRGQLKKFTAKFGKCFDVIIDDGSHFNDDILTSLGYFYSHLNPGGLYFIEDLQAWVTIAIPDTALKIFKKFQETRTIEINNLNPMLNEEIEFVQNNTKACNFYCNDELFVLEKID